jgi:hypothetical protein
MNVQQSDNEVVLEYVRVSGRQCSGDEIVFALKRAIPEKDVRATLHRLWARGKLMFRSGIYTCV